MGESSTKRCTKCGGVESDNSKASLTQWLVSCRCGLAQAAQISAADQSAEYCHICGKRRNRREGTFTQWVLGSNFCTCGDGSLPDGFPGAAPVLPVERSMMEIVEPAIEVDESKFPIARYLPLEVLGTGAFGTVYRARDRELKRMVAIKVLRDTTPEQLIAFQKEAKATSVLKHPNTVEVFDFGVTNCGAPYMVMEFFKSENLAGLIRAGRVEPLRALELFMQVCEGIAYAHQNGVYHRDIKPSNILVARLDAPRPEVRIVDFGLADMKSASPQAMQMATMIVGTPQYMAPELIKAEKFSAASEVYAIGCALYETLCGDCPYDGNTWVAISNKHANSEIPKVELARHAHQDGPEETPADHDLIRDLDLVIERCMAKDPEKRFSVPELFEALHVVLESTRLRRNCDQAQSSIFNYPSRSATKTAPGWQFAAVLLVIGAIVAFTLPLIKAEKEEPKQPKPVIDIDTKAGLPVDTIKNLEDEVSLLDNVTEGYRGVESEGLLSDNQMKSLVDRPEVLGIRAKSDALTGEGIKYIEKLPWRFFHFRNSGLEAKDFRPLGEMRSLRLIALINCKIEDELLERFGTFPELEQLIVRKSTITDKGLIGLGKSRSLKKLDVYETRITDEGVRALSKSPITQILLGGTRVTDKSIDYMKNLELVSVNIDMTDITGAGLMKLAQHKSLKKVGLQINDKISARDVSNFKRALPGCKVVLLKKPPPAGF